MSLLDDFETYSNLLLSVKTHKSERPLEPIEVAKLIMRLRDETGESKEQVSKRISISTSQVSSFLKLLSLPKQVHHTLGWGDNNEGKLAFTTGAIISELKKDEDKETLSKTALLDKLTKDETRRILQLKKQFDSKAIEQCIEEVMKRRTVVERGYLLICPVSSETIQTIRTHASKLQMPEGRTIVNLVSASLLVGIAESALIRNHNLLLTVDEQGYDSILQIQNANKILFKDLAEYLIQEGLKRELR
jgi:hypothetical protein